jgi:hypothetical protein
MQEMRTSPRPSRTKRPGRWPGVRRVVLSLMLIAAWTAHADPAATMEANGPAGTAGAGTPGGAGRITGHVLLGPKLNARQMRFLLYPDAVAASTRLPAPVLGDEMKNVVVYIEAMPGTVRAPGRPGPIPAMRQEDLTFVPHVLPIVRGGEVVFPNGDPVFHNVFSLSRAASFDLGRYPRGESKTVHFDAPGVVKVFCHIHSDMSAVILVLDNPFFTSPGTDGRFAIEAVPPGDYRVTAWHDRARPVTRPVHVDAGGDAVIDFNIPLKDTNEDRAR